MPRTFSLRLLLAGVTLACLVFAAVANRPDRLLAVVQDAGVLLPAAACALVLAAMAPKPRVVLAVAFMGLFAAWAIAPLPRHEDPHICIFDGIPPTWLSVFEERLQTQGSLMLIGSALPGLIAALVTTADAARSRQHQVG